MVFSWNSTQESPVNFGQNGTNFRSNGWVFTHEKNQTVSHTNEPSFQPWQWRIKIYCQSCWTIMGLKPQPKLSRHSDECLVKILDQNTQGVRRSKSQTESEQNRFSENKKSWLFFPVSSFCDSFMDVPPCLGANNIRKCLCEFYSAQYAPRMKLQKLGRNFTSFGRGW